MKTYEEVLQFLFEQLPMYQREGPPALKYDLSRITALANTLQNPHQKYPIIHIAGTNGKGSVSHMIAAVLQAAGYKVGLHTSPHYLDFRERIKVNGYLINKQEVIDYIDGLQSFIEAYHPSFFELSVGLAFKHFEDKQVDVAVIETGLGGRLDSTNIVHPILSIITNIDLDHQNLLGATLEQIATEKAGIIKHGVPVVLGQVYEDLVPIFEERAKEMNTSLIQADAQFLVIEKPLRRLDQTNYQVFRDGQLFFDELVLDAAGPFQVHNIKTVLQAVECLPDSFQIQKKHLIAGLAEMQELTYYIGRWNWISRKPLILADSAHNKASLAYIADWLALRQRPLHIILGMVKDKDPKELLSLFPRHATYYFTKPDVPRGLSETQLQSICGEIGLKGHHYVSVKLALQEAIANAGDDDLIFVGGSSFVVAEIL